MGRFGKKDAPRVVGFDFGAPGPPPPVLPAYPPPALPPYAPPAGATPPAAPSFAAPSFAPPVAPFAPPAAPPVATLPQPEWAATAPAWPAPFQPPPQWLPQPKKQRSKILVGAGIVLAVVMVGSFVANGGVKGAIDEARPLTTPATLSGRPRLTSPPAREAERTMRESMTGIRDVQVAAYGSETDLYLLVAGKGAEDSTGEVVDDMAEELHKTAARVGALARVGDIACYPVTIVRTQGSFCGWGGHASDGFVFANHNPNIAAVAAIAKQARAEVQGG